jgi:hypothetical protein
MTPVSLPACLAHKRIGYWHSPRLNLGLQWSFASEYIEREYGSLAAVLTINFDSRNIIMCDSRNLPK